MRSQHFQAGPQLVKLNVGSLNCRGLNDTNKRRILFDFLKNSHLSIICLQETKTNVLDEETIRNEWHNNKILINSVCSGGKSGTMILINSMHINILDTIYDQEGRIIATEIEIYKDRFQLINTYFPDDSRERKCFINSLYPFIASRYPVIWCGDQNMVTDPVMDRIRSCRAKDSFTYELVKLIDTFSLLDVCREKNPVQYIYTFHRDGSKSRIDKILVSDHFGIEKYTHSDFSCSDHDLIEAQLSFQAKWFPGKGIWKSNPAVFQNEDFLSKFKDLWMFLKRFRTNGTTTAWWVDAKYRIKNFLRELEKEKTVNENDVIVGLKLDLERKKHLMKMNPTCNNMQANYLFSKKKLQKEQTKFIKEKILNEKVDKFNNGDTPNKIFFQKYKTVIKRKFIHSLRDDEGGVQNKLPDILYIAHQYYQNLFKKKLVDENVMDSFLRNLPQISQDSFFVRNLMVAITIEELEHIVFSFKNCKAPGIDGLGIEFYKKVFGLIKYELLDVLNLMLRERFIPRKIKTGVVKLIHKGGDECDIETYRPITLLNLDYKILSKIMDERLKPILDDILHNSQFAKKGKSIKDMNNLIRDIVDDMEDQSVDSFLLQVDFRKAFDSISHEFLNKCLKKMGFTDNFIQMLYAFDRNATSRLLINGHLSKIFKLECGARQGDPLGMDKFIIVLNVLLVSIDNDKLVNRAISCYY